MKSLSKFWNWLNGNKTVIGLVALQILQVFEGRFDRPETYQAIVAIVMTITGASLVHKLSKKKK